MKYGKYSVVAALALVGVMGLVGCNEGSSSSTATPTGSVVFTASLPAPDLSKALIDTNTGTINIQLYSGSMMHQEGGTYVEPVLIADVNITRLSPTANIAKVPVGNFFAYVTSYDTNNSVLDRLNLGGTIAEGTNTLNATFIRGKWTLDTPITLNKTLSADTARIDSVSVVPNAYYYNYAMGKAALDFNSSMGYTDLPIMVNGVNLPKVVANYNYQTRTYEQNVTSTSETRVGGYIMYFNQFKGLNTSTNALQSAEMMLKPTSGTIISEDLNNSRQIFVLGIDPSMKSYGYEMGGYEYNSTFSQDVAQYATSKVTASNKMSGNIIEMRTISQTWSEKCYEGNTTDKEVTCPWTQQLSAAKVRQKSALKGISTQRAKLGKAAVGADGCYRNLNVTDNERYTSYSYDPITYASRPITVIGNGTWTGDACVHPFTATGAQLPATDLNLTVQKVR